MELSAKTDTSVLEQAIVQFLDFSSRTMAEQCVTSMGIILSNARRGTPFTEIGRIDAELEVTSTPVLAKSGARKGLPLKSGKANISVPERGVAAMIVVSRMHPKSPYSVSTGNRWPVAMPATKGAAAFWQYVQEAAQRMVKARKSSTHYLEAGWIEPIRDCLSSPFFKGKYRTIKSGNAGSFNSMDRRDPARLGDLVIDVTADVVRVYAENDVGAGGNDVLDQKHRQALIRYGTPPLQDAIDKETNAVFFELDRRMEEGYEQFNRALSV